MRYKATMNPTQTKTTVYKFGYKIDSSDNILWRSDSIKSLADFRHTKVIDSDQNQFNSLCIWSALSFDGGIGPMNSYVGVFFQEINLMAQDDKVAGRLTIKFSPIKVLGITMTAFPPPEYVQTGDDYYIQCQILQLSFEKAIVIDNSRGY